MKKYTFSVIFVLLCGFLLQLFLPWWIIAVVAAIASLIFKLPAAGAFFAGFVAAALLWGGYAAYLDQMSGGAFADMIGKIFQGVEGATLIYLTAFVGGLAGGLGALTGSLGRNLIVPAARTS
ncbi:MAG TPA: hypothetical protein PKC40_04830 [Saprospiraceae bacterium]|nr:hypothetical protein [Saprospiraceae bacterium]